MYLIERHSPPTTLYIQPHISLWLLLLLVLQSQQTNKPTTHFMATSILALQPSFFQTLLLLLLLNNFALSIISDSAFLYSLQPPSPRLHLTSQFSCTTFLSRFRNLWAPDHELVSKDQKSVEIMLDRSSGSGFGSKEAYIYGFFSAAMKLPSNKYTAGVVTTFYATNKELYPDTHDEIDFEFLGRATGEKYVLETNVYGDGSVNTGREQRFHLWFDPSTEFHNYSILWTPQHIVFFVDDIPIREMKNISGCLGKQYPSKPVSIHASIWDGSDWATDGGRFKADYSYGPFKASYTNLILMNGSSPIGQVAKFESKTLICSRKFQRLTKIQKQSMKWVRSNYLVYDYCKDKKRYPHPPPECPLIESSTTYYNQSNDLMTQSEVASSVETSQQTLLSIRNLFLSLLLGSYLI